MDEHRHFGHDATNYDKKMDFVSPEDRNGSRTANHRFMAAESRRGASGGGPRRAGSEHASRWPSPENYLG